MFFVVSRVKMRGNPWKVSFRRGTRTGGDSRDLLHWERKSKFREAMIVESDSWTEAEAKARQLRP
jgi:hypothetical protein